MIRIMVDPHTLGDISAESGVAIKTEGLDKDLQDYVEFSVTVLLGAKGQIKFYSKFQPSKRKPITPPPFPGYPGK